METLIVLAVVFLLIRGLAKLGQVEKKRTKIHRSAPTPPPRPDPKPSPRKIPRATPSPRSAPDSSKFPRADDASHSDAYVRYLIDVLRVGQPAASEQAVNRLAEMGREALPALREAERDPSAFVRERAQQAIDKITGGLTLAGSPSEAPPEPPAPPSPPAPAPEERLPAPTFEPKKPEFDLPDVPELPPLEPAEQEPVPAASPFDVPIGDGSVFDLPEPPGESVEEGADVVAHPGEGEIAAAPIDLDALTELLRAAGAQPSFGGNRDEILARLGGVEVRFVVRVERTQWTMGMGIPQPFTGGRTVSGHIVDTDVPVAVCLPPASNAVADALSDSDSLTFVGTYADWDGLYDRGKFVGRIDTAE